MREIKFRGYRNFEGNALYPPDKRWIYGYYYSQEGKHWIRDIDDWKMSYCVEDGSVGEYTGLKDKSGKEIYEGDIVREILDGVVTYEPPTSVAVTLKGSHFQANEDCEVIGNIYENPELLGS